MKPDILLIGSMMPEIERELDLRYIVHRLRDPSAKQAIEEAAGRIEAVVTGSTGLPTEWFDRLPSLRLVAVNGVGTDKIDLELARKRGIHVAVTSGVLADAVADLGLALILAVSRRLVEGDRMIRDGSWGRGVKPPLGRSLRGRTLGILGLGQIGRALAERAVAFGMEIAYFNRSAVSTPAGWRRCETLLELAEHADVLTVCVAGSAETRNWIDGQVLDALGPEGILVNIARGSVIDEAALLAALKQGRIAGAGLDVFKDEPRIRPDFAEAPNLVLMPHQGSATIETRRAMGEIVLSNLQACFEGRTPPTSLFASEDEGFRPTR